MIMKKIILTGFEPFSNNSINPTLLIAKELDGKKNISSFILPVVYDECWKKIENEMGDIFLLMGLASTRSIITLEEYAYNEKRASILDNNNTIFNGEEIIPGGPKRLSSPFNVKEIASTSSLEISVDPGRYVCNNLYYNALYRDKNALFIHLPSLENMTLEEEKKAILSIIEILSTL